MNDCNTRVAYTKEELSKTQTADAVPEQNPAYTMAYDLDSELTQAFEAKTETEYEEESYDEAEYVEAAVDESITYHENNRAKKLRKKKNYLMRLGIVIVAIGVIVAFTFSDVFLVKKIEADGNYYYSDEEIMNMAGAQLGVNLLWDVDLSELEEELTGNPYFAEISVKKKFPNTLHFDVKERKQVAAIVYGDKYIVIDINGTVLRKSNIDPKITLLTGLTISKLSVGEAVEAEEESTLETTLAMLDTMEDGDIFFKKIDVSRVIIKAYIYDTLIVKGTPKQMTKAIESGDLQKVVNNLLKNDTTRGTINLGNHNYMSFSPEF